MTTIFNISIFFPNITNIINVIDYIQQFNKQEVNIASYNLDSILFFFCFAYKKVPKKPKWRRLRATCGVSLMNENTFLNKSVESMIQ